jgi:hypothetical protein
MGIAENIGKNDRYRLQNIADKVESPQVKPLA